MRPSDGVYTNSHRLKWGSLPPKYVGRISYHVRVGRKKVLWNTKEEMKGQHFIQKQSRSMVYYLRDNDDEY